MFKIGDFSRLTCVSVKTLRHYSENGLLLPAYIDSASGYRYYTADQLPRLNRILALKELGFSLDQVRTIIDEPLTVQELRGMLLMRRTQIAAQLRADEQRLLNVETRLSQIEQETRPLYDVIVREIGTQPMATLRATVANEGRQIAAMFDEVEAFAARHYARAAASPLMLYHDADYRETDLDIEVAVPLLQVVEEQPPIRVRQLPGGRMACAVYTGSYDRTQEVLNTLLRWLALHAYRIAGPLREVYLRYGADNADSLGLSPAFLTDQPALFVTELQLPIESED